ncbi:OB-fold nucleic acid binding domain-containing protein [Thermodesulfatator atlanticus]|uniref:OB-fold nucleic acid binding domain-containing protein n=1 Tax=Thermodesulfatator atlanticus TaxID=501497 RepID=UPI0003B51FF7|nr:OB-fold nucleic acid binding domain-containing protein [Thermodesulfatator atlanticus]
MPLKKKWLRPKLPIEEAIMKDGALKVFVRAHPLEALRPQLRAQKFVTASEIKKLPPQTRVKVAGLVILVHTPPVRSGKRIIFVTLEDETGLIDLVIPPESQGKCAKAVFTQQVVFLKGRLQEHSGSRTILIEDLASPF